MRHYLLFYRVVSDYLERRGRFRSDHLALVRAAADRGELLLAGALADPSDGAVLLFRAESPAAAEAFARADPYVVNGLVTSWEVREWTTVAGSAAATPAMAMTSGAGVVRLWRAIAAPEQVPRYLEHFERQVAPRLSALEGFDGGSILGQDRSDGVELLVVTSWESLEALRRFTGADVDAAVVDPAARATLCQADDRATNYQVIRTLRS